MGSFDNNFDPASPLGSSRAGSIDEYIAADTKDAINERLELEHVALDSSETGADDPDNSNAQGRHKPGHVGVLFYGTYAELTAIQATGGQIGYANDPPNVGFYHYIEGSGWTSLALNTDEYVADNETLEIVAGSPSTLAMKHDNQQWTTTYDLTDAASITTDCDNSNSFKVILGGNRTLANPTNLQVGATYLWIIQQDAAGSRTLNYGSYFKWPGGSAPVLSTDANAIDAISGICIAADNILCSVLYDFS
jgi:hypothetical protein